MPYRLFKIRTAPPIVCGGSVGLCFGIHYFMSSECKISLYHQSVLI